MPAQGSGSSFEQASAGFGEDEEDWEWEDEEGEADWDEEDAESEAWESDEPVRRRPRGAGAFGLGASRAAQFGDARLCEPGAPEPNFPLAFLATLPLLLLYEWARASGRIQGRNVFELLASVPLQPFGSASHAVRLAVLLGAGCAAAFAAQRANLAVVPGLVRTLAEGALAAVLLGPCLLGVQLALGGDLVGLPDLGGTGPGRSPSLELAMFYFGGAGYEELVCRTGFLSLIYLVVRHAASFLGAPLSGARLGAEILAILGSGLLFALLHLEQATGWLGAGGGTFDGPTFFWRFLAGVLLGTLVRWRGLGVTAWAHGLYNLAAVLGAGPAVFVL